MRATRGLEQYCHTKHKVEKQTLRNKRLNSEKAAGLHSQVLGTRQGLW